ncbi:MAG TPA: hypothetical protein VGJ28_27515, partial [Micromonosporaceae bacterium]
EQIRAEWLALGLSTEPADHTATEGSISEIYARARRARPTFVWVDSPRQALPHIAGLPTLADLHRWVVTSAPASASGIAGDIVAGLSRLRSSLAAALMSPDFEVRSVKRKKLATMERLTAAEALRLGIPFREIVEHGVREALQTSLGTNMHAVIRARLNPLPLCWYGQQDASWIAYFDVWRRLGLSDHSRDDASYLAVWETLARHGGWWWPGESTCVLSERPVDVQTEPLPGGRFGEVRLRRATYRDGWCSTVDCDDRRIRADDVGPRADPAR